jgi:hypothetical protein
MTDAGYAVFQDMKAFVGLDAADARRLAELGPLMTPHQARITDAFYAKLAEHPPTAKLIDGRVDQLKKTHAVWFAELFCGEYDRAYFDRRWRIGLAHVRIGLDPYWVEAVMSLIRSLAAEVMAGMADEVARRAALLKVLDLDVMVINLSYQDDRLDRLTTFTGLKRPLIENIIRLPKK